ncbi:hypothetical protein KCU73_g2705, partial [Aureobasidium melanogenum]
MAPKRKAESQDDEIASSTPASQRPKQFEYPPDMIRPEKIADTPGLSAEKKVTYTEGLTKLWIALEANPRGSITNSKAQEKIKEVSREIMRHIIQWTQQHPQQQKPRLWFKKPRIPATKAVILTSSVATTESQAEGSVDLSRTAPPNSQSEPSNGHVESDSGSLPTAQCESQADNLVGLSHTALAQSQPANTHTPTDSAVLSPIQSFGSFTPEDSLINALHAHSAALNDHAAALDRHTAAMNEQTRGSGQN